MLCDIQGEAGAGGGVEVGAQGAGSQRRVAEPDRDIGAGENEVLELRQAAQFLYAVVANVDVFETKRLQFDQALVLRSICLI